MSVVLTLKRSVWSWLGFPRCHKLTYLISQSMDHELSFRQRAMVNLHFLGCRKCARYQKQLRAMRQAIMFQNDDSVAMRAESRTESLRPEARERMRAMMERSAHDDLEAEAHS